MSDISAPALWSCLDYHINYYVQILHFISLYSCPFHPLLWRRRFCALGHDHSLYSKPYIPTGCPKKRIFFHYQLSSQLAMEGHVPSKPVSQNGDSESAFFWDTLCTYNFLVTSLGILMLQPLLATPAEKSWMEEVSWAPVSLRSLSLPVESRREKVMLNI